MLRTTIRVASPCLRLQPRCVRAMASKAPRQQNTMSSDGTKSGAIFKDVYSGDSSNPLYNYVLGHNRENDVLPALRKETGEKLPRAMVMQLSPEQGTLLHWLVTTLQAKRIIELGVFTGYSSICMATALPPDGKLLACDVDDGIALEIARKYWAKANVTDLIEEHIRPGAETLNQLLDEGKAGTFDLIFVDADKGGYPTYYELGLKLLRPGGVIAFDNMLFHGRVVDPSDETKGTQGIRDVNDRVYHDDRVTPVLLATGDGMLLATKK